MSKIVLLPMRFPLWSRLKLWLRAILAFMSVPVGKPSSALAPAPITKTTGWENTFSHPCARDASLYRRVPDITEQSYMSGMNMASLAHGDISKNMGAMAIDEQERTLREYCNDHPLTAYKAVTDLYLRFTNMQK